MKFVFFLILITACFSLKAKHKTATQDPINLESVQVVDYQPLSIMGAILSSGWQINLKFLPVNSPIQSHFSSLKTPERTINYAFDKQTDKKSLLIETENTQSNVIKATFYSNYACEVEFNKKIGSVIPVSFYFKTKMGRLKITFNVPESREKEMSKEFPVKKDCLTGIQPDQITEKQSERVDKACNKITEVAKRCTSRLFYIK